MVRKGHPLKRREEQGKCVTRVEGQEGGRATTVSKGIGAIGAAEGEKRRSEEGKRRRRQVEEENGGKKP